MRYLLLFVPLLLFFLFTTLPAAPNEPDSPQKLGADLFVDPILSLDSTISCGSCHKAAFAFSDTVATSLGVGGQIGTRNTPSLLNVANRPYLFWDGRMDNLAEQALHTIKSPTEMGASVQRIIKRLRKHPFYAPRFKAIYGQRPNASALGHAIASFERSLVSQSPFDRYNRGDDSAITASAKRGEELFAEKGLCLECHFGADITSDEFRNIGLLDGENYTDVGRFAQTGDSSDLGKFRVPPLRNVALTAPYMHDGSIATLRGVLEYYNNTAAHVPNAINKDPLLKKPLNLTEQEITDLENFLISLTDDHYWDKVQWLD